MPIVYVRPMRNHCKINFSVKPPQKITTSNFGVMIFCVFSLKKLGVCFVDSMEMMYLCDMK